MDAVGPETDPLEGLAHGIHHGRWATDENGRVAVASRKKLLQHRPIEATGGALEIPLSRQDVKYGQIRQLGFDGLIQRRPITNEIIRGACMEPGPLML
jgi:hypothetical protein